MAFWSKGGVELKVVLHTSFHRYLISSTLTHMDSTTPTYEIVQENQASGDKLRRSNDEGSRPKWHGPVFGPR